MAAIFGMIQDLKLYTIISLDPLVTDLTKYSWTSAILAFGNLIVRTHRRTLPSKITKTDSFSSEPIPSPVVGTETSNGQILHRRGLLFWCHCFTFRLIDQFCRGDGAEVSA